MRFMKPLSRRVVAAYGIALGIGALLGVVPWAVVPAQALAADKAEHKETVDQKEKLGRGKFVSFKDGTLTLESNSGILMVWNKISENTKTFQFDPDAGEFKRVEGTADALNQVKAGTWVTVGDGKTGSRSRQRCNILYSMKKVCAIGQIRSRGVLSPIRWDVE